MTTITMSYLDSSTAQAFTEWAVPGIGEVTVTPATDPVLTVQTTTAANGVFALHTFSNAVAGQTYQVTFVHASEPSQTIQVNRESQP